MPIVTAFVSQKGGVGKSTLARTLAAVAAHAGLDVLIADLDHEQLTSLRWYRTRLANKITPSFAVATFETVAEAVATGEAHDLVVLDLPGRAGADTLVSAHVSHIVVVPTGVSADDLHPTVVLLHELSKAGVAREKLTVALCRTSTQDEEDAARGYVAEAGYEVLPGSLPERGDYRIAQNAGRAITEGHPAIEKRADTLIEALLVRIAAQLEEVPSGREGNVA